MPYLLNKKALSNILNQALFISISCILLAIIGTLVFHYINNPELSPEASCIQLLSSPPITIEKACLNKTSNETEIIIKRDFSEFKKEIIFAINNKNNEVKTFSCGSKTCNCKLPNEGALKTYYFEIPNSKEVTIRYSDCTIQTKEIKLC